MTVREQAVGNNIDIVGNKSVCLCFPQQRPKGIMSVASAIQIHFVFHSDLKQSWCC